MISSEFTIKNVTESTGGVYSNFQEKEVTQ